MSIIQINKNILLLVVTIFLISSCASIKKIAVKDKHGRYISGWINSSQFQQIISSYKSSKKNNTIEKNNLYRYAVANSLKYILSPLRRKIYWCSISSLAIYRELYRFFLTKISIVKVITKQYKKYYIMNIAYKHLRQIIQKKMKRLWSRSSKENLCKITTDI